MPEVYPKAPVKVQLTDSYSVSRFLHETIVTSVNAKVNLRGRTKFSSITSIVQLVYSMLGGTEEMTELAEFDLDNSVDASSEEQNGSISPKK